MLAEGKTKKHQFLLLAAFWTCILEQIGEMNPLGHEYQWSTHDVAGEEWLHLKYTGELVYLLNCRLHVLGWMIFID